MSDRRGDRGLTGLAGGAEARKDDLRVEAGGALDEASSFLGLAKAALPQGRTRSVLSFLQQRLQCCCSLAQAGGSARGCEVTLEDVLFLEREIDRMLADAPFSGFVLPGGCEAAARLDVCRSVVRRAERRVVALGDDDSLASVRAFLNRLSDYLWAVARETNREQGAEDEAWQAETEAPGD